MKTAKANVDVEDQCPERVVRRNSQSMVNSIFNPKASGRPFLQKNIQMVMVLLTKKEKNADEEDVKEKVNYWSLTGHLYCFIFNLN